MWKDEWQAWQLATKTESFSQLLGMLPGEGHPTLWFILLRGWNHLISFVFPDSAEWFRLQLVHLIIVGTTLYLVVFTLIAQTWKKLLFLSSYFILYEYSVIARPYMIIVLLSLLAVIILLKENDSIKARISFSVVIFLLTQTEVYGVFMAAGFLCYLLWQEDRLKFRKYHLFPMVVLIGGTLLFYLQVQPSEEISPLIEKELRTTFRILSDPFQSLTLNTFMPGFTETVFREEPGVISLLLAAGLLYGVMSLFKIKRRLFLPFILVFILFYCFGVFYFLGGVRNWGLIYIFTLCLLFLKTSEVSDWKEYIVLSVIFLFQFIHGANVILSDVTGKFSNSRDAGEFIAQEIPEEVPVIGLNKAYCVALTGYSERSLIGMPDKNSYYYFEEQDWRGKTYLPDMEELLMMKEHLRSRKIIVVYNKPLEHERFPLLKPLTQFDEPSMRRENYYFYYF